MSRLERGSLHLSALAVALTGLGLGWLKYFHQHQGEFGPEPLPLQAVAQHAHVFVNPMLTFALGMMVRGHALPALRAGTVRGRATGLGMIGILAPMILSGYGMQICVDPAWRNALAWIHGPFSLLFLLAYAAHLVRPGARVAPV